MGWFYGFKLHLIINDEGEILSFCLTSGNIDDRNETVMNSLTKEIFGKLFADRGYISQNLFEKLLERNITLVTRAKKNMKNKLIDFYDRLMLRKRAVIESVNDFMKNICDIEQGLKNKLCKCNNQQNFDHTKNAAKKGNAEERPDASCGIKR